jgi:hypothetical protein
MEMNMRHTRRVATVVGVATLLMGMYGCVAIPPLFEMCTVGEISGPIFLVATLAVATLLGGGVRAILAKGTRGKLFIASATLFLSCVVSAAPIVRFFPLQVAMLGAIAGSVFALSSWLRTRAGGQSSRSSSQ